METLEEIENNNRAEKSRRKIAGLSDKRWMEEIDWLIAEVKRLRKQLELEHDHGELFLTQIKDVRAEIEIERLKADWDGFIHGGL